jgi:hypothetical protein
MLTMGTIKRKRILSKNMHTDMPCVEAKQFAKPEPPLRAPCGGVAQPGQSADRRLSRLQRGCRSDAGPHPTITALDGGDHLERVCWRDHRIGTSETHDIRHVFAMTGAVPNTRWLEGCIALDARGFIKTSPDLSPEELTTAHWPPARPPYLASGGVSA